MADENTPNEDGIEEEMMRMMQEKISAMAILTRCLKQKCSKPCRPIQVMPPVATQVPVALWP